MLVILGRQRLGAKRFGRNRVLIGYKWPQNTRYLYIVSEFTSLFPGRIKLLRKGDRGYREMLLRDDIYHYFFVNEFFDVFLDHENPVFEKVCIDNWCQEASIAKVGIEQFEQAFNESGIHPELIIHDEHDPAYFTRYAGHSIIRINTVENEVDFINVKYRCSDNSIGIAPMDKVLTHNFQDYWQAVINCNVKHYVFLLNVSGNEKVFGADGIDSNTPIVPKDRNNDIRWWHGTIYYLIFPDRYGVSFSSINERPDNNTEIIKLRQHLGGNIRTIIEKLEHLQNLGIETVYMTPIYKAPSYHRYDVIDHREIDDLLGDINDFKRLLENLHKRDMKIILDIVVNHTSPCAKMFIEAIREGKNSRYWDWYRFLVNNISEVDCTLLENLVRYIENGCRELPAALRSEKPFYESFFNYWGMAKLNHDNENVIEYLIDTMSYWSGYGVDGFRLDVGHALPDDALKKIYNYFAVKDKPVILEVMMGNEHYDYGAVAESSMNYDLRRYIIDFFIYKKITAYEFVSLVMKQYLRMGHPYALSMYNLLGSHDTPRIKSIAGKDRYSDLMDAYTFLFLIHGSPSIYYGDEIGMEGGHDPYCRKPMIWDSSKWDKTIYNYVRHLIYLRKKWDVLRYGFTLLRAKDARSFIIERRWKNNLMIANYGFDEENYEGRMIEKFVIGKYTIRFVKL